MYCLADGEDGGIGVPGELYRVSEQLWPELEASEPPNLYRGRVVLEDASEVWGILYPRGLADGRHPDIGEYGGWRGYTAARAALGDGEGSGIRPSSIGGSR
jgi:gamma-glutamylaminecyclotransferase